jgi:hypothetical protein
LAIDAIDHLHVVEREAILCEAVIALRDVFGGIHDSLPNIKGEPRDERRAQTENGGAIALARTTGSAFIDMPLHIGLIFNGWLITRLRAT